MKDHIATLLIIEDDLDIADMLNAYFRVQGYEVLIVNWGEDGIKACLTNQPDLVILDIRLPDIDGFEVARRLRENRKTREIPIIFLTERRERMARLKGLELHAEDYITKPFDIQELRLRVRNALDRNRRSSITHSVTGLPEGEPIDEALNKYIQDDEKVLLVISLLHLDYFREIYGFVASNDLLRAVSMMIRDSVQEISPDSFLGHLTSTDFLVICRSTQSGELKTRLRKRLEQSFAYFYRDQDREADLFRDQGLSVKISQFDDHHSDVNQIKQHLERSYRQG